MIKFLLRRIPAFFIIALIFSLSALYSSCKRDNPDPIPNTQSESQPPASAPTLTQIQNEIFTPSCAASNCHGGAQPPLLTSGNSYGQLVGVTSSQAPSRKRVEAGNAGASYLINKLENTQSSVGGSGTVMPPSGALSSSLIQKVKDWINDGAKNN